LELLHGVGVDIPSTVSFSEIGGGTTSPLQLGVDFISTVTLLTEFAADEVNVEMVLLTDVVTVVDIPLLASESQPLEVVDSSSITLEEVEIVEEAEVSEQVLSQVAAPSGGPRPPC
uniref:Secreted protein n=1 Tax=Rodentolepis nana TaxID=102285 RepID=A0A158QJD9_RODNA